MVFYVSGHGLGHATRSIELLKVLAARRPDARIVVRTAAPRCLFHATAPKTVELATVETDVGVVQIDSLNIDERETAIRAARFYSTFDERADAEAAFLDAERARIVLGDIPPLACAAAARAGVASIAIASRTERPCCTPRADVSSSTRCSSRECRACCAAVISRRRISSRAAGAARPRTARASSRSRTASYRWRRRGRDGDPEFDNRVIGWSSNRVIEVVECAVTGRPEGLHYL